VTNKQSSERAIIRQVYVGAVRYSAGDLVGLDEVGLDEATQTVLRHVDHGASTLARSERSAHELAEAAMEACLSACSRERDSIDAVILASNGLDAACTLDAEWLGALSQRLGLSRAAHYQTGMAGCAGFHWAARVAASLIASDQCDNILVVTFDKAEGALQRLYGEGTDFPYLTGDAAAACLFSSSPTGIGYQLKGKVVNVWDGNQALRASLDDEIRCIDELLKTALGSAGVNPRQLDVLITNNYSLSVSKLYCSIAEVSYEKAFTQNIATHAHCFGSDNLINLHCAQQHSIAAGAHLMLFSAGPFQWGACVLQKL